MNTDPKAILVILDGWGIPLDADVSAIQKARTPFMDHLYESFPHATLQASGPDVGLPARQMGNSEVGHMNLGAGRVVFQELQRINLGLEDGTLRGNPVLQQAFEVALRDSRTFHIMGLVSEGGVHSHSAHIKGLVDMAIAAGISELMVHAFTDGRDSDPHQGAGYVQQLQDHLREGPGRLATVTGRYYAMGPGSPLRSYQACL